MEIESIEHCRVGSAAYLIAVPAASTSRAPEATPARMPGEADDAQNWRI